MNSKLDFEEYFDIELANSDDYDKNIINRTTHIEDDLAIYFDTNDSRCFSGFNSNNLTTLLSLSAWTGANITNNFTLYDVGLTGIDNGRFKSLTGETLNINTVDTKIQLFQITGKTGSTSYNITSATTNGYIYISLSGGGGFQGFYKLAGYDQYNIFPNRTELGWYVEQWIKYSGVSNNTNSNFFFYMGAKQENKFWNIFSGETGLTTTSGISISPSVSANTDLDLNGNCIGFSFSGSSLGVRWLSGTTDCNNNITGITMQESYSKHGIFDNFSGNSDSTDWINIGIRFRRYNLIDDCAIKSGTTAYKGDLTFYLNARPIYEVKNFEEPIFKSLNTHKTKQQGVPFNLSWGFGSIGLKESQTFSGPDNSDSGLTISNNFDGNLTGGLSQLRFYVKPLSLDKIIHNFELEKSRYNRNENFGSRVVRINRGIST